MMQRDDSHDRDLVHGWMQELASAPLHADPLPDPSLVWWKAQLLRQWDAQRQANRPIDVGERVQAGIGIVGAVILLGWTIEGLAGSLSPAAIGAVALGAVLLVLSATVTVWSFVARD